MSTIQNIEAICQLESLTRKGMQPNEAVMLTHSKEYAETTLIQAGKRIVSGKIVENTGSRTPIGELLHYYEEGDRVRHQNFDKLIAKYGLTRNDKVLWDYDIELTVGDFADGGTN